MRNVDDESRIAGRTEAVDFISTLIDEYRTLGMDDAAEMLEEKIEEFAST